MDEAIWRAADERVASGRTPGYVGAVRIDGRTEVRAHGTMAIGGPPMREDTLFRIASVTKPFGGALALSLVEDGTLGLDDPVARWLPEVEQLEVLRSPDAPLDQVTTLERPLTIRHLLTFTSGFGVGMEATPLHAAMRDRGVHPGALTPPF